MKNMTAVDDKSVAEESFVREFGGLSGDAAVTVTKTKTKTKKKQSRSRAIVSQCSDGERKGEG